MHRAYHRWWSPSLHRDMELLEFGHGGARVVAFPTSGGRFFEWENRGLVRALGHALENGWLHLTCVDAVDRESWYAYHTHPGARVWRHEQYTQYVMNEVLPWVQWRNPNPYTIFTGASFGAFHALSMGLRYPDRVNRILSMSGLADIKMFLSGYHDETVYRQNPVDFIPNEHDGWRLDRLRSQNIILAVGNGDRLVHQNRELSGKLWGKGIGNALREWDGFAHDWPVWSDMIQKYIGGND
ncbi:Putative esterase [Gemmata obscuriglobus]|uniref:Esterase n=2 Tax=Gemmata obscuriglobus TaxID=114 RepID=A0A2Z3GX34_9BACT|nr:esterase [Gemmata obscuriglobus]QEG28762.1 Putative esterase [Gemmata obscuriglobus]VTS07088.1 Putative esterase OS=Chloroflexus aggregans (strain MD-66 / DSM 9485) GN=Cagg_0053 PE=4 SV=1: Esterase [Gemmata obscuriglobus UQM 2246]